MQQLLRVAAEKTRSRQPVGAGVESAAAGGDGSPPPASMAAAAAAAAVAALAPDGAAAVAVGAREAVYDTSGQRVGADNPPTPLVSTALFLIAGGPSPARARVHAMTACPHGSRRLQREWLRHRPLPRRRRHRSTPRTGRPQPHRWLTAPHPPSWQQRQPRCWQPPSPSHQRLPPWRQRQRAWCRRFDSRSRPRQSLPPPPPPPPTAA